MSNISEPTKTAVHIGSPFDVLRRAKRVRNGVDVRPGGEEPVSDEELVALFEAANIWENRSVWVLLVGLAVELLLVWAPSVTLCTRIGETVGNAMVVLGVWAEVAFGNVAAKVQGAQLDRSETKLTYAFALASRAERESAEARKQAAQLEKEAAEARERTAEIEKLTAWRHVTPDQREALAIEVARLGADSIDLLVEWQNGDPEAFMYSREIIRAFARLSVGVRKIRWQATSHIQATWFGLNWVTSDARIDIEIFKEMLPPRQAALIPVNLATHLGRPNPQMPPPNLYVFVGPKPPVIDAAMELAEMGITLSPKSDDAPTL